MKNQREISLKIEKRLEEKCEKYGEAGAISCIKFKRNGDIIVSLGIGEVTILTVKAAIEEVLEEANEYYRYIYIEL